MVREKGIILFKSQTFDLCRKSSKGNPFSLALIKPQIDCYFRLRLTGGGPEESYENDQQSRKLS